jgi:hypothetical protein
MQPWRFLRSGMRVYTRKVTTCTRENKEHQFGKVQVVISAPFGWGGIGLSSVIRLSVQYMRYGGGYRLGRFCSADWTWGRRGCYSVVYYIHTLNFAFQILELVISK